MPTFRFKARNRAGNIIRGEYDAADETALYNFLERVGLKLLKIDEETYKPWQLQRRNPIIDKLSMCRQLFYLLRTGITPIDALNGVRITLGKSPLRGVLLEVILRLKSGKKLAPAFEGFPRTFSPFFIAAVAAGEKSGKLAHVFDWLADYYNWLLIVRGRAFNALAYPLLTLLFASGIVFIILAHAYFLIVKGQWTIPPEIAPYLLASPFVQNTWIFILVMPWLLWKIVVWLHTHSKPIAFAVDWFILNMPRLRKPVAMLEWARFARYFAMLYRCGIDIVDSLDTGKKVLNNEVLRRSIAQFSSALSKKMPLSKALAYAPDMPPMIAQALLMGEKTGDFDKAIEEVAYYYEREANYAIDVFIEDMRHFIVLFAGGVMSIQALYLMSLRY